MREVLGSAGSIETSALKVIDAFDTAAATETLDALTATARTLSGHEVGLRDELNGRQSFAMDVEPADSGTSVAAVVAQNRVRGRDAARLNVDGGEIIVASIETSAGRLGSCWLHRTADDPPFVALDYLVTERLAIAASQNVSYHHNQLGAELIVDENALEELLASPPSELRLAEIARRSRLDLSASYVAISMSLDPPGSLSTAALSAEVQRRLSAATRRPSRAVPLQRIVAALVPTSDAIDQALQGIADHYGKLGITIRIGVGDVVSLDEASVSWRQAKEALALHSMAGESAVVRFRDLGALQLLRHISREQLMESSLYRLVTEVLPDARTPPSTELLEVFLDEGSLRKAAARVFLHHTTVESRIRKIESQLGVDLSDPRVRFELQLVLKAARVVHYAGDIG